MNTILMYVLQNEKDLPQQKSANTAYYIVGKEVRIIDNLGQETIYALPAKSQENGILARVDKCEEQIDKIVKYLTSFN